MIASPLPYLLSSYLWLIVRAPGKPDSQGFYLLGLPSAGGGLPVLRRAGEDQIFRHVPGTRVRRAIANRIGAEGHANEFGEQIALEFML